MSSDYRILCLSHDPALVIDQDYRNHDEALRAAANPSDLEGHRDCNLLVGRYSAPLIEVACPGGTHCKYHASTADTWTDACWLRLLHAAYVRGDEIDYRIPRCWTRDRVLRLGPELGVDRSQP